MLSKKLLANPKVLASAGLLAMVPKIIIAAVWAVTISLFFDKNIFWGFFFVLYPIVGTIFDIMLYVFRNKIWSQLPESDLIPENWQVSSDQLLQFAKQLPKVRLMRFVGCILILPFIPININTWNLFAWIVIGYFIFTIFDGIWLKIFKLRKPKFITAPSSSSLYESGELTYAWWKVGSPAWFIKQARDRRSRDIMK